jgi:P pilus assembly chaperone PapD
VGDASRLATAGEERSARTSKQTGLARRVLRGAVEEDHVIRASSLDRHRRPPARLARALRLGAAAVAALALPSLSAASGLVVTPAVVELGADRSWEDVSLRNHGDREREVRAGALAWEQDARGAVTLRPSEDVSVFPDRARLAPGETRRFRVSFRGGPPGEHERAYRLALDVQDPDAGPLARALVPVFVAPERQRVAAELRVACERAGSCRVVLRNVGTVRVRPDELSVAVATDGGPVAELSLDAWWVLAAGERVYEVPVPPEGASVAARAELGTTVLRAEHR